VQTIVTALNHIKAPILLVYGSNDKGFHRYAKILHDKLPNNIIRMIQDANHRIPAKKTADLHNIIKKWMTNKNKA
jgi:pimeloyl-ACP methyl ester carboxylesterase